MKHKSESKLFKNLRRYHPDLLSELNRVLIIVNAYDLAFKDTNDGSLHPSKISNYVSEYLQESSILGERIDPHHIIPISAMWALKAQEWGDDPDLLINDPKGNSQYNDALSVLDYANYSIQELLLYRDETLTREKVKKVSELLYGFSNITIVEQKLKDVLQKNSEGILLRSATDDSTSKIQEMIFRFKESIMNARLEDKRADGDACNKSMIIFTVIVSVHMHDAAFESFKIDVKKSIQSIIHALSNNIKSAIITKLYSHLNDIQKHLNRTFVENQILLAKKQIPEVVENVIVKEWDIIALAIENEADRFLVSLLDAFVLQLTNTTNKTGILEVENLVKEMVKKIHEIKPFIIPTIPHPSSFSIEFHEEKSEAISDTNLKKMIVEGKTQMIKSYRREICGARRYIIFGPKECHDYIESIPYDVANFSPDTNSLKDAFMDVAKTWMGDVQKVTDDVISQVANEISNNLKSKLSFHVDLVKQFEDLLATYDTLVKNTEADIELLQSKIKLLGSIKNELKTS